MTRSLSSRQAATVRPAPGRKLARSRYASVPRRRSRLAGWIWSAATGGSAAIARAPIKVSMAWPGRIATGRSLSPSCRRASLARPGRGVDIVDRLAERGVEFRVRLFGGEALGQRAREGGDHAGVLRQQRV